MRPVDRTRRDEALRAANRSRGVRLPEWKRAGRRREGSYRAAGWLTVLPMAMLLFLLLRTFVIEAFRIPSSSMEGTLLPGDFLLVNKWVYGAEIPFMSARLPALRAPQHADVVVFDWPVDPDKPFVKRLVGLPGDTLTMRNGALVRNGVTVQEPYLRAARDSWGPVVVPARHFYVLGDNRTNSLDSRSWGFVPDSLLRGAPFLVYYSFVPDSTAAAPWLTRIRWARLGTTVR
jgi:signal peptidase I